MKDEGATNPRARWTHGVRALLLYFVVTRTAHSAELRAYETQYYVIHTDLDSDGVREATMRMTRMAEEYYQRTKDFSGVIDRRLDFFLYTNQDDYVATGAPRTSAGYFDGTKLVALSGDLGPRTWHTVQHEGFHQFARFMIRGDLPAWLNEGLAEYFAEGVFTGDEFITGLIPQGRLDRLQRTLKADKFKPLSEMMGLSLEEWNSELAVLNYDQGWSMVQFLAHGENKKYQQAFQRFMGDIGDQMRWEAAWNREFGGQQGFEKPWRDYWLNLPANPTVELYAQANVSTLTSFLARAFTQQQKFATFDDFIAAAKQKQLKAAVADWLPPSLLKAALEQQSNFASHGYTFAIHSAAGEPRPQLVCTLPDGRRVIGKFTAPVGRVSVKTEILPKSR